MKQNINEQVDKLKYLVRIRNGKTLQLNKNIFFI